MPSSTWSGHRSSQAWAGPRHSHSRSSVQPASLTCGARGARWRPGCSRRSASEPPGTRARRGDLTDAPSLQEVVSSERADAVIHLAAELASQRDARKVFDVNVEGTRRLLDACTADGNARFVFASTVVTG